MEKSASGTWGKRFLKWFTNASRSSSGVDAWTVARAPPTIISATAETMIFFMILVSSNLDSVECRRHRTQSVQTYSTTLSSSSSVKISCLPKGGMADSALATVGS